jgi:hypothetical protein
MNERVNTVVLVVYAAVLGWVAHSWWLAERRSIAWEAAEKAREQIDFAAQLHQRPPAPEASAGAT